VAVGGGERVCRVGLSAWGRACCLNNATCNAHTPYCHLWPLWFQHIFPHYLITSTIFGGGKKLLNIKLYFDFLYNFYFKHLPILRRIQRTIFINIKTFLVKYPLFLPDFEKKPEYLNRFSKKKKKRSNVKFHQNKSSGNRVLPYAWTDRHGEANSRFSQVCERP
jgi:hypothetical protein